MTTVIYHRADFDGIFCREIASKFLRGDVRLVGWDYNDPVPEVSLNDDLYMLDISVNELMGHPKLVWIDHHKSAIEKYPSSIIGYRVDGVAACRLAWQWFTLDHTDFTIQTLGLPVKAHYVQHTVNEPFAVRLAGEYDIWDKRDERAELFQHGLKSQDLTEEIWEELLDQKATIGFAHRVQVLLTQGKAVQYTKNQENASIIKSGGFDVSFEGLTFLACNHARFNSLLFTAGYKSELHDALLGFTYTGKVWRVSLYHAPGKEHHDLSLIATKYGGGGHRGAYGFVMNELPPWLK